MKSFLKFIAVAAGVLLLSGILAPILFQFLPYKFEKIFNRLIMIFTLAAIVIFVRINKQTLAQYGLQPDPDWKRLLMAGFLGGVIILVLLTVLKLAVGVAYWNFDKFSLKTPFSMIGYAATGFLVGTIEEYFFRGVIFSTLRDKFRWGLWAALIVTSAFYAILHFVNVQKPFIDSTPDFADSLKLMAAPFLSLQGWETFWRAAVGLFFFGLVLNWLLLKSKSLYMSIGLHAGCVFFVKSDRYFVDFINDSPLLWGSGKMYDSLIGWLFIGLMGVVLAYWSIPRIKNKGLN